LSSARTTMGQVHSGLEEAALRLGIRPRMGGFLPKGSAEWRLPPEEQRVVA
ncbi:MAG: hypothetical protein IM629_05525, partial [Phenylobacterium sp.]|nr:hypothetical protein [Phenylobacterium sp.]